MVVWFLSRVSLERRCLLLIASTVVRMFSSFARQSSHREDKRHFKHFHIRGEDVIRCRRTTVSCCFRAKYEKQIFPLEMRDESTPRDEKKSIDASGKRFLFPLFFRGVVFPSIFYFPLALVRWEKRKIPLLFVFTRVRGRRKEAAVCFRRRRRKGNRIFPFAWPSSPSLSMLPLYRLKDAR